MTTASLALTKKNRRPLEIGYRTPVQAGVGLLLTAALLFPGQSLAQTSAVVPATTKEITSWQPQIHFYSPSHWIDDPNGPILLNNQYHLFFQWNPNGVQWGNTSWGHTVSHDLIRWKQLSVAIPIENGEFIFSSSSVEDRDNTSGLCGEHGQQTPGCIIAIYTGASKAGQRQNTSFSRDGGTTWTKYSSNPVLDLGLKDFRDPKVFWYAPSKSWVMVIWLPDRSKLRFYRSTNVRQWKLTGEFGAAGVTSGVWECPDLFELPVMYATGRRVSSRWLLSVNLYPGGPATGSGNQYLVRQFDGFRFIEDHPGSGPHWADWGKDWYASTSFSNILGATETSRDHIWLAWMSNTQYAGKLPSLPGRGELTITRRVYFRQPAADSVPSLSPELLLLVQEPILALSAHESDAAPLDAPASQTVPQANARITSHQPPAGAYLLRFTLVPGDAAEAGVRLRRSTLNPNYPAAEETVVGIDKATASIFVDRTRFGKTDWAPEFPIRMSAPLKHAQAHSVSIQIVVDNDSVEVFAEDGEPILTNLIYPVLASHGLAFYETDNPPGAGSAMWN